MLLDRPFQSLTPTVDGDVLNALAHADAAFTPGELHRLLGRHSVAGVRLALNRLVGHGVVLSSSAGRAVLYRLNREHVLAGPIIEMSKAKERLIAQLRETLGAWRLKCSYAALFGSAATGQMVVGSDIDLFVVRPESADFDDETWRRQVDEIAERCTAWTGNDCRVLELSEAEVAERPTVVEDIVAEGVHLSGPASYLKNAVR